MVRAVAVRALFAGATALLVLVEALGARDLSRRPWGGYRFGDDGRVTSLEPGGPAERAGFVRGDLVLSQAGVERDDVESLLRLPRPGVGETRRFVLERGGTRVTADLTYAGLPREEVAVAVFYAALGFLFLAAGFAPLARHTGPREILLAAFCVCAAVDFVSHPYVSSFPARMLYMSALNAAVFFGYAFLLHLLVLYPARKRLAARPLGIALVYAPASVMSVALAAVAAVQPRRDGLAFRSVLLLYALFFLTSILAAVAALAHSCLRSTPEERRRTGVLRVAAAVLAGIAPPIAVQLVRMAAPGLVTTGGEYAMASTLLIPVALAAGIARDRSQRNPIETGRISTCAPSR